MPNPFNCPDRIYAMMQVSPTPMLVAIKKLGPERVQFSPGRVPREGGATTGQPVLWTLDGRRATYGGLLRASGMGLVA